MFKQLKEVFNLSDKIQQFPNDGESNQNGFELAAYGSTDKGFMRDKNEDSFLLLDLNDSRHPLGDHGADLECLMAVAEGSEHSKRGQIASELAIDILRTSSYLPNVKTPIERLVSSVEIANQRIFDHAEHDFSLKGMAATMAAVYVKGTTVYVAYPGNLRPHVVRNGTMIQLAKVQTLAQILEKIGIERRSEISRSAYKALTQAVGPEPSADIWQSCFELMPNDTLLICTAGLTSEIPEQDLVRIINENIAIPKSAVRRLIWQATLSSGEENITVIVAQFRDSAARYNRLSHEKAVAGSPDCDVLPEYRAA
ncbi:MAG: serine/threonine-protein phosphatase [Acidobacteria bacterium]|nr:serine/threonine-protein phosphatase [Acidobacteriota bacterium]